MSWSGSLLLVRMSQIPLIVSFHNSVPAGGSGMLQSKQMSEFTDFCPKIFVAGQPILKEALPAFTPAGLRLWDVRAFIEKDSLIADVWCMYSLSSSILCRNSLLPL